MDMHIIHRITTICPRIHCPACGVPLAPPTPHSCGQTGATFTPGQPVNFWRDAYWGGRLSYAATVVSVGPKRIRIALTKVATGEAVLRYVSPENLTPRKVA
jgi:hypothetical protein